MFRFAAFLFSIIAVSFLSSSAVAQIPCSDCGAIKVHLEGLQKLGPQYDAAEAILKSKPSGDWSSDEINSFLYYSLAIVYSNYQIEFACNDNQEPSNLEDFPELEHVTTWPSNPFNNWEPVKIMDYPTEFSPGDVVVQTYDGMNQEYPITISFQLYIFGPSEDWPNDHLNVMILNRDWATPPIGAVYTFGQHVETESERLAREEFFRAMEEAEASSDSGE